MTKETQLEALLFWYAEPVTVKELSKAMSITPEEVTVSLEALSVLLKERGVNLVMHGGEVSLRTHPEMASMIEKLTKEELNKDLGKAGLETLSIVLYEGPISRSQIDYIRGTNSQYILRNLLIRGLIKKIDDPKDERKILYEPTLDLLSHLGIRHIKDLPDRERIRQEIATFRSNDEITANENKVN